MIESNVMLTIPPLFLAGKLQKKDLNVKILIAGPVMFTDCPSSARM